MSHPRVSQNEPQQKKFQQLPRTVEKTTQMWMKPVKVSKQLQGSNIVKVREMEKNCQLKIQKLKDRLVLL
jgi:hypothetical protein